MSITWVGAAGEASGCEGMKSGLLVSVAFRKVLLV